MKQHNDQDTAAQLAAMRNFLNSDKKTLELVQFLEALELAAAGISKRMEVSEQTVTRYHGFMTAISREIVQEIRNRKKAADIQN